MNSHCDFQYHTIKESLFFALLKKRPLWVWGGGGWCGGNDNDRIFSLLLPHVIWFVVGREFFYDFIRCYSLVVHQFNSLYINSPCLELCLNQRLEDEPCMVIPVPVILPMIAWEYITTVMGWCMSSNWASVWNGCVYQSKSKRVFLQNK